MTTLSGLITPSNITTATNTQTQLDNLINPPVISPGLPWAS